MLEQIFTSITQNTVTPAGFFICTGCSLLLGFLLAAAYRLKTAPVKALC